MTRRALLLLCILVVIGCKRHRAEPVADASSAAVDGGAVEAPPTAQMVEPKDLPLGHWETTEGSKLCLTILPDGLVRFASEVPSYRNPARIFGQVTHAESDDPNSFRIWVDVSKILAKEIGACHRRWMDFELFEAEILGQRVTSPNADAQKIPQLGGGGTEPPRGYSLRFDQTRESLDLCTLARESKCRKLTKKKSPSDISRVRRNGTCKLDEDCVLVTDGEQCDPCLCPSRASLKSWPKKPDTNDTKDDLSWELTQDHMCGKLIPRRDDCPACPQLHAACNKKVCVLKP